MTVDIHSSTAAVPEAANENSLNEHCQVKSKVGHVAKFQCENEDQISNDDELYPKSSSGIFQISFQQFKQIPEFIPLTKAELKSFINNPYWRKIRLLIGIFYVFFIILLLLGSIMLIIFSTKCSSKSPLKWYEKDLIYEVDLQMFSDSDADGQGDLNGFLSKFDYLQKYSLKTFLFRPTIFQQKNHLDFLKLNSNILNQTFFDSFIKLIHRKDMNVILDLPLSSTNDLNGTFWYGFNQSLPMQINNPCNQGEESLGCRYWKSSERLPLDFNEKQVKEQAENRIRYWLLSKNVDGIRIDLPLQFNQQTNLYEISSETISQWNLIKYQIEKQTKTKLILFDIPFDLLDFIKQNDFHNEIIYPILDKSSSIIKAKQIDEQIDSFHSNHRSLPKFWKFGSLRLKEQIQTNLSKEIQLTMTMLFPGTPIILYGEELSLDYNRNRLMLWTSDLPSGGFSSCLTDDCQRLFHLYEINPLKTNVKRQEATDGNVEESFLKYFSYLTKLRQENSFRYGLFEKGFSEKFNLFWFIRELSGQRGYLILFNLNKKEEKLIHLSLYELTNRLIPLSISYEYQWPKNSFSLYQNQTHINSDNLFISSKQSIFIFSWKVKLIKPETLFQKAKLYLVD
ncbi:unnamed protein product [Adineta ricciae]|uniref:Glycosyl hydrolase family 13 catalytic domain-containing protein n=1 Tax=Adineta ricciae TaxID=249248 RepID=A0A816ETH2_ADIRI|nr:unnamed protein product [Adineta ricciae]